MTTVSLSVGSVLSWDVVSVIGLDRLDAMFESAVEPEGLKLLRIKPNGVPSEQFFKIGK